MNSIILPNTDIQVSAYGLGTMMWGDQTDEAEAFRQMEFSLENKINFWDTAEFYTIPGKKETQGNTERIIGEFFAQNPERREKVILASKFCARGVREINYLRDGNHFADEENIRQAFSDSCARLQTEYLDLYQIHWPDRKVNIFGQKNYDHQPQDDGIAIEQTAKVLKKMVDEGKIRAVGISNETPWGAMKWIEIAKKIDLPLSTIQNAYSLLGRNFETGLSEICLRENIGLLAYSPLAMGVLSGKYLDDALPKNSRRELFAGYAGRYKKPGVDAFIKKLQYIATQEKISLAQLSLAFVAQQNFVTSTLIGATSMEQMRENLSAFEITLSKECVESVEKISEEFGDVCY